MTSAFSTITSPTNIANRIEGFQFDEVPNAANLAELWEQYRIDSVMVTYYPPATSYEMNVATDASGSLTGTTSQIGLSIPTLYMYADYDDITPATSELQYLARPNLRTKQWNKPVSYKLRPRVRIDADDSAALSPTKSQWLDTNASDVIHYGLKVGIVNNFGTDTGTITYHYRIKITYILSFKGLKYHAEA